MLAQLPDSMVREATGSPLVGMLPASVDRYTSKVTVGRSGSLLRYPLGSFSHRFMPVTGKLLARVLMKVPFSSRAYWG